MARRIIIVDDDRETRDILKRVLEREGYEVHTVANGLRLIATLHVDRPDMIILDVMMSWINGFELCRAIKANPELRAIPIIIMSGRVVEDDEERGLAAGAAAYFPKPVDLDRLTARVRELAGAP